MLIFTLVLVEEIQQAINIVGQILQLTAVLLMFALALQPPIS